MAPRRKEAVPALTELLDDDHADVCDAAGEALKKIDKGSRGGKK